MKLRTKCKGVEEIKFSDMVGRQQAALYRPGNCLTAAVNVQFAIDVGRKRPDGHG